MLALSTGVFQMQRTLVAVACGLALAGGSAYAQQQQETPGVTPSATNQSSGSSITERAKETIRKVGEKSKEAAAKVKHKTEETAHKAKEDSDQKAAQSRQGGTQSMGAWGSSSASDPSSSSSASSGPSPQSR